MIDRYSQEQMRRIWSEENKFATYLKIELLNAEFWQKKGLLTDQELQSLCGKASFSLARIQELEKETRHDVIAFTRAVSETLGKEKRFIHYGLTSTDVVDTANAYRLRQANEIILEDILAFMAVLKDKAWLYKNTPTIGRTHGMHAEITSFGLKWALWYDEMQSNLARFISARKEVETGKISGAVGNYAATDMDAETYILSRMNLHRPKISTQVLSRDRYANYMAVLALVATTMEQIATEIRHLQRTEIGEVSEYFASGQKGSSAMPHKHNPIASENICGLARIMRSYMIPAYEDVLLWHERDISHSSVERIIFPDATTLLDHMLTRYAAALSELVVYEDRMKANIALTGGVIYSERVMTALIDKGLSRETAYDLIQPLAEQATETKRQFRTVLEDSPELTAYLPKSTIVELFETKLQPINIDKIYARIFAEAGE